MKNRIYLFTVAVASFMCISCTKTQTTLSENEKTVNPPIMGWSSWNAFRVDISEDIIKHQADLMVKKGLKMPDIIMSMLMTAISESAMITELCIPTNNVSRMG